MGKRNFCHAEFDNNTWCEFLNQGMCTSESHKCYENSDEPKYKSVKLSYDDECFCTICICAVRYALGRKSYMPSLVQEYIRENIQKMSDNSIDVMIRDIEDAHSYGDENIDKPGWIRFLDFLMGVRNHRRAT